MHLNVFGEIFKSMIIILIYYNFGIDMFKEWDKI